MQEGFDKKKLDLASCFFFTGVESNLFFIAIFCIAILINLVVLDCRTSRAAYYRHWLLDPRNTAA